MRIVVNDIAASIGGAMTVLRDFYSCVCEHDHENEWIFLLNDRYFEETENVKIITLPEIKSSALKKMMFDFITGRRYISKLAPDVVLSLQNIITFGLKVPQIVYIHQSIPFQDIKRFSFFRKSERRLAIIQHLIGKIIKLSAQKSDCVIVQTEWMNKAICRHCTLSNNRVVTSLPQVKNEQQAQENEIFDRFSFFYPTADAIYKNNDCIWKASAILDSKEISHRVTLTLSPDKSAERVQCVGRIPHEEVMERYQSSTLVFPSYIETFGYPLAEARMMGTIILASDTPFSHEVLKDYENAYYFDPFNPEELAALMEKVATGQIIKMNNKQSIGNDEDGWKNVLEKVLSQAQRG